MTLEKEKSKLVHYSRKRSFSTEMLYLYPYKSYTSYLTNSQLCGEGRLLSLGFGSLSSDFWISLYCLFYLGSVIPVGISHNVSSLHERDNVEALPL